MRKIQEMRAVQTPAAREEESGLQDFGEGLGVSGLNTYYGLKDLASPITGGLDDEDRATLKDWEEDAGQSGWGTAGEVVGDVGQILLGGGAGGAALKGATMLPKFMKGAVAADTAASAVLGATQLPQEGDSRLANAGKEAVAALAGGGLGKAIAATGGKLSRGISQTDEAVKLLDEGVPLTPGQASSGGLPRSLEYAMQAAPVLAKGREAAREAAVEKWGQNIMKKAAPEGVDITAPAREGAKQLKQSFETAYTKAWSTATKPDASAVNAMESTIKDGSKVVGVDGKAALTKATGNLSKLIADFSPQALKTFDHSLKRQIGSAARAGDEALEESLNALRVQLRDALPADAQDALKAVDSQYGKYLVVKKAGAKAKKTKGVFTPDQFMDSVGAVGGETRTFTGKAPLQEFAEDALTSVGRSEPNMILDLLKGTIGQFPTNQPLMDAGGRAMLGRTGAQKGVQKGLDSAVGRRVLDSKTVNRIPTLAGAGLYDDE